MAGLENWNWALDGWIVAAGVLCAVASALLGNFLVLRKMSMLGDAISHAVLPGLAAAFLITGARESVPMFLGAALVGVLTALLTEWIRRYGRVDEGGAMGVVFTALFALGLVMIVQAADQVDLDPGCVLYGAIELTPLDTVELGSFHVPRVVVVLSIVLAINLLVVVLFYKELKLTSFDPELAKSLGINAQSMHYLLMTLVAVTAVASFETVGNILVVAMFVVPVAAAYMCTDRLATMIVASSLFAAASAVLGHIGAIVVPRWIGYRSTTTAGMMAVAAGFLFGLAVLLAPRYGLLVKLLRRRLFALRILAEDVLALLYRAEERTPDEPALARSQLRQQLDRGLLARRAAYAWLRRQGDIRRQRDGYALTEQGRRRAQSLVRAHRLWEQYLETAAGLGERHLHENAEQLEHFTNEELRRRLADETASPRTDPHGAPIPPESQR
ncbi:MAG: iron ABC transporter [Planctomycetota bacterium]|nr:MAG: iron ABC transporter [Planctomycetota bacterium]